MNINYLAIVGGQSCMSTNKTSVLKWANLVKSSVTLVESPLPIGVSKLNHSCIFLKQPEQKGESFSADNYDELLKKVKELCDENKN